MFFMVGSPIFHSITLGKALHLAMSEHRKTRQCCHHRANAKIFVALPKLVYRGALVGIVHEVDVALENLWIELDGVPDYLAIVRVLFVTQHIHERAVVHAMHAQRTNEISFEEPERLG